MIQVADKSIGAAHPKGNAGSGRTLGEVLRTARLLSIVGVLLAVVGLSVLHARVVAVPSYPFNGAVRIGSALGYAALLGLAAYVVGLPEQTRSDAQAAWLAVVASVVAALGISLAQLVVGDALLPRFVVFGAALLAVPIQVEASTLARRGRSREGDRDRVLIVAATAESERLADELRSGPERGATLVGSLLPDQVDRGRADSVLVAARSSFGATVVVLDRVAQSMDGVIGQAAVLHESGVRVRTLQGFYEDWFGKVPLGELERASLFFDIGELHRVRYGRVKRLFDVTLAIITLPVLAVLTPVVAVGNLVANRGPLLYRQVRVGKGGHHFTILKFRTMAPPAVVDDGSRAVWTSESDPRVTGFGRVLRRTHVDELPQILNILRGDLAVVGPRPEQPEYVEELSGKLAFYDMRHLVRPGLTGWAQVKHGYAGDEHDALEKLQYEFFYLRHQDLRFDLRIIVRTLRSLVGGPGRGR